jgi:hypothetical protein
MLTHEQVEKIAGGKVIAWTLHASGELVAVLESGPKLRFQLDADAALPQKPAVTRATRQKK